MNTITINEKANFSPTLEDLSCMANRTIYSINSKIIMRFLSVRTSSNICNYFDRLWTFRHAYISLEFDNIIRGSNF